MEATQLDEMRARYVNADLAEYEIAANADVQDVDVIIVPEKIDDINAMNVKRPRRVGQRWDSGGHCHGCLAHDGQADL